MICFFGEKCLKNALYKIFHQTKVVINQNLQLLYYVTFFRYPAPLWSYSGFSDM